MIRRPDLIDYQFATKKKSTKKLNSSFYKNRGGGAGDITELTPFRGTQDSKGLNFDRNGSAEEIPRETMYDNDGPIDEVQRAKILDGSQIKTPQTNRPNNTSSLSMNKVITDQSYGR